MPRDPLFTEGPVRTTRGTGRKLDPDKKKRLYTNHKLGAFVRSGACVLIWVLTVVAFIKGAIGRGPFMGASASLTCVAVMNVPMLLLLRRTSSRAWFELLSFAVNVLEILGYTVFIYFVGGFRSTYLTPIYAAVIFYVGVMAPMRYPLILAGMCSLAFSTMVYLEHFGYLPHQNVFLRYTYSWDMILFVLFVLTTVLFVIALMAAYTSRVLGEAKITLKKKNLALERMNSKLKVEIEDRIKAELALRASEEKLQDIFDNVPDALFTHDLNGRFVEGNRSFREMLGLKDSDPIPEGMSIRDLVPAEYHGQVDEYLLEIAARGRHEGLVTMVCSDGGKRVLEYRNTLITDGAGRPCGVRGCARDITDRLRTARERAVLQDRLQRAQKMEAIGLLAGGVAHDLNNILSGLVSYPDFLLMELPAGSPLRKPLMTIKRSGEKAANIVQDLLTMARRGVRVSEAVNLNRVVMEYLDSLDHKMLGEAHPGVRLEVNLAPDLGDVEGSPIHIFKTVMNLVCNAYESIEEEGDVRIATFNRSLEMPLEGPEAIKPGRYAVLVVSDSGRGMTLEDRQHLFEPFYTRKVMGRSGTGLGMAVVWGAVKDHNGYVDLQSEPGCGTVITLYFPVCPLCADACGGSGSEPGAREKGAAGVETLGADAFRGSGQKILVVDDMKEQQEMARMILERLGYRVDTAGGDEEAVQYLRSNRVDLVLLDMIMEDGMDGLETYRRILEINPNQKALIVSGFSEGDRVQDALAMGASGYVRKPYLFNTMAPAVKGALKDAAR
jgi:PAS domain S-box-containing protein